MRPGPETATGKLVRRQSKRTGRNWHWEVCSTCRGGGKVRDRFQREQRCEPCRGRGRRAVDDYTGAEVVVRKSEAEEAAPTPFGMSWGEEFAYLLERDTKTTACPFCDEKGVYKFRRCEPCRGSGRIAIAGSWVSDPKAPRTAGADAVDVQIDAFTRRDELGDWRALELALIELRRRARTCYRVFRDVFLLRQRQADELDVVDELALRGALLYLDLVLPLPITVPAWATKSEARRHEHLRTVKGRASDERALKARNKEIERDLRAEKPVQWIADQYGLGVRQVYEINAAMLRRTQGRGPE